MKQLMGAWLLAGCMMLSGAWADPLRIGVSLADLGNPFFYSLAQYIQDAATEQSGEPVEITVLSSAYDLERQQTQIQRFIDERVDIILLSPSDSAGIEPAIRSAQRAGIVVTAIDIDAKGADISVTTDNVQAGEIACQHLVDRLNARGRVAIINGASVSSVTDRVAGCRAILNNYPDIELVSDEFNAGGTFGGGLEAMTFLLSQHPEIEGVFAINDPTSLGAAQAAELGGRNDILITSVDGSPDFIDAMRDDRPSLIATAAQSPPEMAWRAIELSLERIANPVRSRQTVRIPTHLITRDSIPDAVDEGTGPRY